MANWNYGGNVAPSFVTSKDDVRNIQRQLGVTVDGLWGPKTQAAYEASGMANQNQTTQNTAPFNYTTTDLDALQAQIYSKLSAPTISYSMPSQQELAAQISEYLRPSYENAIAQRRDQTLYNRAQIDADAASRGMGRSTYVTDVKDQAMDAEAADIAALESNYNAALLQAVQDQYNQHLQNKLAADQYNSQSQYAAQQAAWQSALGLYGNNLAQAQAASSGGGGSRNPNPDDEDNNDRPITSSSQLGSSAMNIASQMSRVNSNQKAKYFEDTIANAFKSGSITREEADYLQKAMGL